MLTFFRHRATKRASTSHIKRRPKNWVKGNDKKNVKKGEATAGTRKPVEKK